jgi:integrase
MSKGMRASEFMLQLSKRLVEERKLAESTAKQYLQTLYKLSGEKSFNNLAWSKNIDAVQKIIDTYAPSTQSNQYMVLSSALSLFADKPTYKSAHKHWKDKMMETRREAENAPKHEKNDKQEANWIDWEDVLKKKSELKEKVDSFTANKKISNAEYETLLKFVVLSLYTDIPPRRNQDFLDMFVVKKSKDMDKSHNYYDLETHSLVFNVYKTAKTYGQQIIKVPDDLKDTLAVFLKFHPLKPTTKAKEPFPLLVKADGTPLETVNSITRILNKIFGKKVGSSMLRHSYITGRFGDTVKDMEQVADEMGHSSQMAQEVYTKF